MQRKRLEWKMWSKSNKKNVVEEKGVNYGNRIDATDINIFFENLELL